MTNKIVCIFSVSVILGQYFATKLYILSVFKVQKYLNLELKLS